MKKLFLIPLMALFSCVMAWGATYYVGGSQEGAYEATATGLASAFTAATNDNDVVQLGANVALTETFTVNNTNNVVLNLGGFTLSYSSSGTGFTWSYALAVAENANLTISGSGNITSTYPCQITETVSFDNGSILDVAGNLVFSNGDFNLTAASNGNSLNIASTGSVTAESTFTGIVNGNINGTYTGLSLAGGNWTTEPEEDWLAENYYSKILNGYYNVYYSETAPTTVATLADGDLQFATLAEAIPYAAVYGDITLCGNVEEGGVTVSADVTINYSTYDVSTVVAGEGYTRLDDTENKVLTFMETNKYNLKNFLTQGESGSYTVENDVDISGLGTLTVVGNKVLTLSANVYYQRQTDGANIVIPAGATLTLKGNGTLTPVAGADIDSSHPYYAFMKNSASMYNGNRPIDVYGTLVVGVKDDANNCPNIVTTSIARGAAIMVLSTGNATINNVNIEAAATAVWNEGTATINGGVINSTSSAQNGINGDWYAYCVRNHEGTGVMTINGGTIKGVHGAVASYSDGLLTINGGTFFSYPTEGKKDNHYVLYVATLSVVDVRGGDFYVQNTTNSAGGGIVVLVDDDDAGTTFGVVNIYGGRFGRKADVANRASHDAEYVFPASIPTSSAWYSSFGSEAPLPAGYEYYSTNDATYPWGVRAIEGKTTEHVTSSEETIPWQQTTTWSSAAVPTDKTIVTLPADKTVVVDNEQTEKDAVADQIFINQGASLTVEAGTTLTVGEGGVNIGNGGQLVVNPGAIVKIGDAGVITSEENALVIENNETKSGVFLLDPDVTENTQPKATVKMYSKAYKVADNNFRWQHFAIPTIAAPEEFTMPVSTAVYYLDYNDATTPWKTIGTVANMNTPFQGYNLTNWANAAGTVYTFYGNIIGNHNGEMPFVGKGYNFCGNSYTAPIDIATMLVDIKSNNSIDVEPTINIYSTTNDQYEAITKSAIEASGWMGTPVTTQIAPMQGFFLNLRTNTSGDLEVIDYSNSVWGNPSINTGGTLAPARNNEETSTIGINMIVSANGRQENVLMLEGGEYTAEFDDEADASKKMSEHSFNLWANINNQPQAIVATNRLENTILGFQSVVGGEYTITFKTNNLNDEYMLIDLVTGEKMTIGADFEYTFMQEANTNNAARFEIVASNKVPTALDNVENNTAKKGIYTMTGQFVGNDYNALPAGVYILDGQKIVK